MDRIQRFALLALFSHSINASQEAKANSSSSMQQNPQTLGSLAPSQINSLTEPLANISSDAIYFERGSAKISSQDRAYLLDLAKKLKGLPVYVIISAFTESIGPAHLNLKLARLRAQAIERVLRSSMYFSENQILSFGYGSAPTTTQESESEGSNRRVSIALRMLKDRPEVRLYYLDELRARGLNFRERRPPSGDTSIPIVDPTTNSSPDEIAARPWFDVGIKSLHPTYQAFDGQISAGSGPQLSFYAWVWDDAALRIDASWPSYIVKPSGSSLNAKLSRASYGTSLLSRLRFTSWQWVALYSTIGLRYSTQVYSIASSNLEPNPVNLPSEESYFGIDAKLRLILQRQSWSVLPYGEFGLEFDKSLTALSVAIGVQLGSM